MKTLKKGLFYLVLGLSIQLMYGQTTKIEQDAKKLQDQYKNMIEKASLIAWPGAIKTCKPEDLIQKAVNNVPLVPRIKDDNKQANSLFKFTQGLRGWSNPKYKINKQFLTSSKEFTEDGCSFIVQSFIKPIHYDEHDFEQIMIYKIWTEVIVNCECDTDNGDADIKNGAFVYSNLVAGRYDLFGVNLLDFNVLIKDAEPTVKVIRFECCPEKKQEEEDKNPKEDGEDQDDKGSGFMANPENCCDAVAPKQTIGVLPGFSLSDNFKNFNYDVALEYLRNFGTSIGNDTVHAGALVGYMGTEAQDGEVKQTMWYVSALAQNRSPLRFCKDVQWVNQLSVQYGEGKIDASGNKDDFSTFSVNLNTGFNYQFNDNFSMGVDVGVASFGNITYKDDNGGEDFKVDVGELAVNKGNRVRFGFRFRF